MRKVGVGDKGVAASACRPVGKVWFGDKLVDAVSEGEAIAPGARVRVVRHDANRLVVEKTEDT